ncbi:integrase catalytic domain-containing protein [Caerostris darwini]|uniref:Integrase catalytic domain-containing protein n=1 Tax=Caerostris darwini TaxID=1538125 RepID=A0AAV4TF13_9ARAC|nr:integrase catalytic domain-containing protein [Caerostris darwini]
MLINNNESQFLSTILQQVCYTLDIAQILTPVYHPANQVERKNIDLKPGLTILVGDDHDSWSEKLPRIRFALNPSQITLDILQHIYNSDAN